MRNRQQERLLARCTCLGNSAQAVGAGTHLQDAPKGAWFSLWSALALRDRERYGAPDFGRPASHAVRQSNSCFLFFVGVMLQLLSCQAVSHSHTLPQCCLPAPVVSESCFGGPDCPCLRTPEAVWLLPQGKHGWAKGQVCGKDCNGCHAGTAPFCTRLLAEMLQLKLQFSSS